MTEEQERIVRAIAAGTIYTPREIRAAAVRHMTGYTDEYDTEMLLEYIETL